MTLPLLVALLSCGRPGKEADDPGPLSTGPAFSTPDLAGRFAATYIPVPAAVAPAVPPLELPIEPVSIDNLDAVLGRVSAPEGARDLLLRTGIASIPFGAQDDVAQFYENLAKLDVPVVITSDSVLHLYHIQFDETLRDIEERALIPDAIALTRAFQEELRARCEASDGIEHQAMRQGLAYFSVARALLEPDAAIPAEVEEIVREELALIDAHEGFKVSPLFGYHEDYSQYVPRGHYTRSPELERYFRALMWYGRLTFLVKGSAEFGPDAHVPALVSVEEAQRQTMLAATIAGLFSDLAVGNRTAAAVWERMYTVTAYYVGLADDLTPHDYRETLAKVFGPSFEPGALEDQATFRKLQAELAKLPGPAIYGGTGQSAVNVDFEPGRDLDPAQLDRILGKTMGLRFMGQRAIPDSDMMGRLVAPSVGVLQGPAAFTTVDIPDFGPVRAFPRGLDVMAVLGSDRALEVLEATGDAAYKGYDEQMAELRGQFGALSQADWNRNLYWSWLFALKALIEPPQGEGWPTFMTTDAWKDKQLSAALGSWSSLRHDTILYAKQSYTPTITAESVGPPERPIVGYVEPVPEFYARLVALTAMTERGLGALDVLDEQATARLRTLHGILERLQRLSEAELRNEALTEADYAFIQHFGEALTGAVTGAGEKAMMTTLIADVHTDQNSGEVLEVGTGALRLLLVAYRLPQGHTVVGVGPVFSTYEFRHPMGDRLTDEKWREMLQSDHPPAIPDWTASFAIR